MKKIFSLISLILVISLFPAVPMAVDAFTIDSITWQDPNNAVLLWDAEDGYTYNVYRASAPDGEFSLLSSTTLGSYRDDTAEYPNTYYYKVERCAPGESSGQLTDPAPTNHNPRQLTSVYVIMYHNFITEKDIAAGVEFEEYSLDPSDFEADLIWLLDNGYTTITSADLLSYLKGEKTLPKKCVIISIDDGTHGVYTNAWALLKKYNMKADFNVIGAQIDATWDNLDAGGTRDGEPAPYCTWEELVEMKKSGQINLCSHTYGLHRYNREGRIGMSMTDGETEEEFAALVKSDYELALSCIEGWTGTAPTTVAYPYSKRSEVSDRIILDNTGYEILMAGEGARGTAGNYFVPGCDAENQLTLMSRPCRMDGTPLSDYITRIEKTDAENGVNILPDTLLVKKEESDAIAKDYVFFSDVSPDDWFSGSVYYAYLNSLMKGVSYTEFAPNLTITRAMAATLLHRITGEPGSSTAAFSDVTPGAWYEEAAAWADETKVLEGIGGAYLPDGTITREALAQAMYACARVSGLDTTARAPLDGFSDAAAIDPQANEAFRWAVARGIFRGNADGTLEPQGLVTRAQMATVLQNWLSA